MNAVVAPSVDVMNVKIIQSCAVFPLMLLHMEAYNDGTATGGTTEKRFQNLRLNVVVLHQISDGNAVKKKKKKAFSSSGNWQSVYQPALEMTLVYHSCGGHNGQE